MSGPDIPDPSTEPSGGLEPLHQELESVRPPDLILPHQDLELLESARRHNRELLEALAASWGFVETEEMGLLRAEAVQAARQQDAAGFRSAIGRWHELGDGVQTEAEQRGFDVFGAQLGQSLVRAGMWLELNDPGNFWEEMSGVVLYGRHMPQLEDSWGDLQRGIETMSSEWQPPSTAALLEATSGYMTDEELEQLGEWEPYEALVAVVGRLLESGVEDVKAFLIEHGLIRD